MLKIKSILVSLLAIAVLAGCSNELDDNTDGEVTKGYDVAYVSISLTNPKSPGTRASTEQKPEPEESLINELYVITFDATKDVVKDEAQLSMPLYWEQASLEQTLELLLRILRLR